jgi:hypothetical protein
MPARPSSQRCSRSGAPETQTEQGEQDWCCSPYGKMEANVIGMGQRMMLACTKYLVLVDGEGLVVAHAKQHRAAGEMARDR